MFTALIVRSVHPSLRRLVFTIGVLACLPAVAIFIAQLVLAKNDTQAAIAGLMIGAATLGSMTHATILWSVMSGRQNLLWLADVLLVVAATIGLGAATLNTLN